MENIVRWFPPSEKKNSKACLLKWGQVSLYLWENISSSCHRNQGAPIPEDYDFHNTEPVVKHRKMMLSGHWPSDGRGCEHCRDQEAIGGISDRLQWLSNEENKRYVPIKVYENPDTIKLQPTQLSVHFNNKCNMKCVYCGPNLSSAWVKEIWKYENEKTYDFDPWELDSVYKERLTKFYTWMEKNYRNLKAFDILGGEPFIQLETFDCIDWMIEHPNTDVDFEIYSNLQVKHDLFVRGMTKLKRLSPTVRKIDFVASIDCWGEASEYIRYGLDLELFEKNWIYLLKECPEINPTMNWTVSSLSIPYTADLIEKVFEWSKIRSIAVNYNRCIDPKHYDPCIFPSDTFKKDIDKILKLNETLYKDHPNPTYIEYIKTIFKEINQSKENSEQIRKLIRYLNLLDQRRNTDWHKTFPWLVKFEK